MDKLFLSKANTLMERILSGHLAKEEWFALEAEVNAFFSTIPADLLVTIDELFAESGAGEELYMVCSALRLIEDEEHNRN